MAQDSQSLAPASPHWWNKVYLFSLIAVFLLMSVMSFSYGISGDEVDMNEYGKTILNYFTSFGSDQSVFRTSDDLKKAGVYDYNRDNVVWYYGGLFDLICAAVNKVSPLEEYTTRHLLNAWAGFLAIFFAASLLVKILDKRAGTLVIWLMFLSPFFLGHAMNNPKDVPFAAAYMMAIYFIVRLFERLPSPKKTDYLWAILSIGAAINIRVGGILLLPYLGVLAGLHWLFRKNGGTASGLSLGAYIKPILITGALGYLAGSLLWPYGLQNPISNPLTALQEMSNFKVSLGQLWDGEKMPSDQLPALYLPVSFAYTNTYALLAGLGLGMVFLWFFRKEQKAPLLYFVVFTGVFPLLYIMYTKANVYHAWRHVLFIFPSLVVLAAFGWDRLGSFFKAGQAQLAGLGLCGFLLLEPMYFTATTFPNTVTYYNALAGGTQGAYGRYEVDYYYNSLKQCADWLKKNEAAKWKNGDTVRIYSNAAHILTHYFSDQKNVIVDYIRYPQRNMKPWDYTVFHIALLPQEELRSGNWLPPSTLFKAECQSKVLSAVIKRPSTEDLAGYQALQANNADAAIAHFDAYLKADPKNTGILNTAADILMQLGRIDSAEAYVNRSWSADSSAMETKQLYGMMRLQKRDFGTAQIVFTQLVQANPQYPKGYFYLALAQLGSGQAQQALGNFNTSSQDPELRQAAYKYMGDCYMQLGNQQEAARLYQAAGQ
jgi:tetratricopeptide (TPR) repeat protein